jgi:hypothetical protein
MADGSAHTRLSQIPHHLLWKKGAVNFLPRKKRKDKFLICCTQPVRFMICKSRKFFAYRPPEMIPLPRVQGRKVFDKKFTPEESRMGGHVSKAAVGKLFAYFLFSAAIARKDDQSADFRKPVRIRMKLESSVLDRFGEGAAMLVLAREIKGKMGFLRSAVAGQNQGTAYHFPGSDLFSDKEKLSFFGFLDFTGEGVLRVFQSPLQNLPVRRQIIRIKDAGESKY